MIYLEKPTLLVGPTRVGKTRLAETLIAQDIPGDLFQPLNNPQQAFLAPPEFTKTKKAFQDE
jgi:hypothetical protein